MGSQIAFEGSNTRVEVSKQRESNVEILKERFQKEKCEEDWRDPIKEALMKEGDMVDLKALKDYNLVKGKLYSMMLGGILSRCVGQKEAHKKLKEVHSRICRFREKSAFIVDSREQVFIS